MGGPLQECSRRGRRSGSDDDGGLHIDLNPVRAGIVAKVEDYRWCGYASALGGNRWTREGLGRILSASRRVSGDDFEKQWAAAAPVYRLLLYSEGEVDELPETGKKAIRAGFEQKDVEKEAARSGQMSLEEVLRCRIRYFSDGLVLGSVSFVNEVFKRNRGQFGKKRRTGARAMKEADWRGLHVLRDLRGKRIS